MSEPNTKRTPLKIYLAQPRGFCAGVDRAIAIVERALLVYGRPIYVRHEIVHNRTVVENLRSRGAIFIDDLSEVPDGATLVFSAHGVPKSVEEEAARRGFRVFDATCPLVTKVHREVARMRDAGYTVVMIGHKGHPEVEGTVGQVEDGILVVEDEADVEALQVPDPEKVAYVTQTTLSLDDSQHLAETLKKRFPQLVRVLYVVSELTFTVFCALVFYYSLGMLENMVRFKQVSAALEINVMYAYLIIPISMALTIFRTLQGLYRDIRNNTLEFESRED